MSDLYKDIIFKVTKNGEALKAKQNNGYKYSICTAVPFIDTKKYIKSLYENNKLDTLTESDIIDNVTYLTTYSEYTLDHGILLADSKQTAISSNLPVRTTFDKDEVYCAYSVRLNPRTFKIRDFDEDLKFDGIIYLAKEYKTIADDTAVLENNTSRYIPFAIAYFYGEDKIQILHDQDHSLLFNVEVRTSISDDSAELIVDTENTSTLHLLDDGKNTDLTLRDGFGVVGTKDKLFMADLGTAETESYDTYSKLNIMNTVGNKDNAQISLQYVNNNTGRTWDGRRGEFFYTSGSNGTHFGIREVKGSTQYRGANLNLISLNNSFTSASYENGLIYSRDNTLTSGIRNMFVNSTDNNVLYGINNSFTNSDDNILSGNYGSVSYPARNLTFLNSDHNRINAVAKVIKYNTKGANEYAYHNVWNASFVNSNNSFIKGGTTDRQYINFINGNRSLVKTPTTSAAYSQLIMGGNYNFLNNVSADAILIGNGLEVTGGSEKRIIIGNYNDEVNHDYGDCFVIADGYIRDQAFVENFESHSANSTRAAMFFESVSSSNSLVRRHNLFTVNAGGYAQIKGNDHSWVRLGTKGLTAYDAQGSSGKRYEIDYGDVYDKINVEDAVFKQLKQMNELIDTYTTELSTQPRTYSLVTNGNYTINAASIKPKHNDIVNVTFVNKYKPNDPSLYGVLTYTMSGENGFGTRSLKLSNGASQSFLYVNDEENKMTGYSRINN